jgi:hypothetical protein
MKVPADSHLVCKALDSVLEQHDAESQVGETY